MARRSGHGPEKMNPRNLATCGLLLLAIACSDRAERSDPLAGVEINLDTLDEDGLRGPPDGKVAVAYEFTIPDRDDCRAEVRRIDPSVRFMPGSPGRIGAGDGECLCVGSTHQRDHQRVLESLIGLPYVDRIIECHFE